MPRVISAHQPTPADTSPRSRNALVLRSMQADGRRHVVFQPLCALSFSFIRLARSILSTSALSASSTSVPSLALISKCLIPWLAAHWSATWAQTCLSTAFSPMMASRLLPTRMHPKRSLVVMGVLVWDPSGSRRLRHSHVYKYESLVTTEKELAHVMS